jgi:DNA-binding CsgD family transcriptional regulator
MFMTVTTHLTKRESEILDLVCLGFAYKLVADKLSMKPCTVATHIQKMLRKTECHSVPQMISKLSGWRPKIEIQNFLQE